jgi:hypothetical protein
MIVWKLGQDNSWVVEAGILVQSLATKIYKIKLGIVFFCALDPNPRYSQWNQDQGSIMGKQIRIPIKSSERQDQGISKFFGKKWSFTLYGRESAAETLLYETIN